MATKLQFSNRITSMANNGLKIGIEYTRVPDGMNPVLGCRGSSKHDVLELYVEACKKLSREYELSLKPLFYDRGEDMRCHEHQDGAVEIASNPLSSLEEIKKFHSDVTQFYKKLGKVTGKVWTASTIVNDVYVEGGGEHIHVSGLDEHQVRMIIDKLMRMPFVHWFMSDWCDTDSSPKDLMQGLKSVYGVRNYSHRFIHALLTYHVQPWGHSPIQIRQKSSEYAEYRKKTIPTVEFRFFRASEDLQHMLDNIDVALALADIHSSNDHGQVIHCRDYLKSYKAYAAIDAQEHIADFKRFIERSNLAWSRYERYVKTYEIRRERGYL